MWRLIKWSVFLGVVAVVALWVTGYKIQGKTVQEHLKPYLERKVIKEGLRDIRAIVGEGLKAAGEAVSEDVTDDERKQLDDVLKKELQMGKPIAGAPGQEALPPEQNKAALNKNGAPKTQPVKPPVQQPLKPVVAPKVKPTQL